MNRCPTYAPSCPSSTVRKGLLIACLAGSSWGSLKATQAYDHLYPPGVRLASKRYATLI
jgi:hypothetical protein